MEKITVTCVVKEMTMRATKAFVEKKEEQRGKRKEQLLNKIRMKPGETAYSLSKLIDIPLSSIQNLLNELEEELEIKIVETKEKGRIKKTAYIMGIDDFIHDFFNFVTIDHPTTIRLMKNARKNKKPITFAMPDGSEQILMPNESIESFIKRVS